MAIKTKNSKDPSLTMLLTVTIICLGVVAVGCWPGYYAVTGFQESWAARKWPTVEGRVLESDYKRTSHESRGSGGRKETSYSYRSSILYEYVVEGRTYSSGQVAVLLNDLQTRDSVRAVTAKYPKDKVVKVYHSPTEPARAYLEPENLDGPIAYTMCAGIFIGIPLLIIKGIWGKPVDLYKTNFEKNFADQELKQLRYLERVLEWNPGSRVQLHRDHQTFFNIVIGSLVIGVFLAGLFVAVPLWYYFSGWGLTFVLKTLLYASLAIAFVMFFVYGLAMRRRDADFDWSTRIFTWQLGWGKRRIPFGEINDFVLKIPKKAERVDGEARLRGKIEVRTSSGNMMILEADFRQSDRGRAERILRKLIGSLADSCQKPWINLNAPESRNENNQQPKNDTRYRGEHKKLVTALRQVGAEVEATTGSVVGVDFKEIAVTDGILDIVSQIGTIQKLKFSGGDITEEGFRALKTLVELRELHINGGEVTFDELTTICSFSQLRELSMRNCKIADPSLRELTRLPSLRVLDLSNSSVDASAELTLREMQKLESLTLTNTQLGDVASEAIKKALTTTRLQF